MKNLDSAAARVEAQNNPVLRSLLEYGISAAFSEAQRFPLTQEESGLDLLRFVRVLELMMTDRSAIELILSGRADGHKWFEKGVPE